LPSGDVLFQTDRLSGRTSKFRCKPVVLAAVVILDLGEQLVEEELFLAIGDDLIDHLGEAVVRAEEVADIMEGGAVLAEAAEVLGGECSEQQLADGGQIVLGCFVGHGFPPR
jgi:hypothetical protein